MIVAHNLMAMNAQRQYGLVNQKQAKSTEKLSFGYRINRAADDAAGLSISEKMRRQIRGLTQGVQNTQDGVSLCQVADGALSEVCDIVNRMEELAVEAANGTKSDEDRQYIQEEINSLLEEVNRIADTTTFNEIPVFRGGKAAEVTPGENVETEGNIPFSDFKLADMTLGDSPIYSGADPNHLGLQAIVDSPNSAFNGKIYNLIFGSGSTSRSSVRVKTNDMAMPQIVNFADMQTSGVTRGLNGDGKAYWTRNLTYQNGDIDIKIVQTIAINENTNAIKDYVLNYRIENQSAKDVDLDFMFHVDTAYNNNDQCEGYFIGGNRVEKGCVYSDVNSKFTAGSSNDNVYDSGVPNDFSIVDVDNALAFTEKIGFGTTGDKPDSLSFGNYSLIFNWGYYNNLDSHLGGDLNREDLGFSAMWNYDLAAGSDKTFGLTYGIAAVEQDRNLQGVTVNKSGETASGKSGISSIWIQSGSDAGVGMELRIREMNTDVLGLTGMDVSTVDGANDAMNRIEKAQKNLMDNRGNIGAQQNRLEHTINNEENIVENTTAAESIIRDTDMAKEMVNLSLQNIMAQAGQSMMGQANQNNQMVLSLLQ